MCKYAMDKTTKIFLVIVSGLGIYALTKELILSLVICFWLIFVLFSLPYQLFLFTAFFLLLYYLLFRNITLFYPVVAVCLGLLLAVLPRHRGKTIALKAVLSDTKTMIFAVLTAFFFFALLFSYQTYLGQGRKMQKESVKPLPKTIIQLK